jgi:hypothetical protein
MTEPKINMSPKRRRIKMETLEIPARKSRQQLSRDSEMAGGSSEMI